jgi:Uma2 family endonuclease
VGYISKERQATLPYDEWFNPNPPELAVEVISPTDQDRMIRVKVANYLAAGTVVWVVYPPTKEIEVYRPGQSVDILSVEDTLDGGPVLPEFKLAVLEVFPASE